jgi:predicted deacylase
MNDLAIATPNVTEGDHLIGAFGVRSNGPTLIAIGGIHGNEPAGALALDRVAARLANMSDELKGRVYLLSGNTRALTLGSRFIDADLNRHWTPENMSRVSSERLMEAAEGVELTELDRILDSILVTAEDEVYVVDLHSTSAEGKPFATVGDTLRNREFAQKFPVTILLGIEEQLQGTMLEYLNNAGAVTLGFEGGNHTSPSTIDNHESLVWLALENAGIIENSGELNEHRKALAGTRKKAEIYEVRYRHAITADDDFVMNAGYNNFDPIRRGQALAIDKRGEVKAVESGTILMPLYQRLGEDGFFIGRQISPFWLWLSALVRRIGIQKIVQVLPGVSRDPDNPETLIVNTSVARLFPLQVFHLLGFRRRRWVKNKLIVSRRKHDTESPFKTRHMLNG